MATYSSLSPEIGLIHSGYVEMPLPPQTKLQSLCGKALAWLNEHYKTWVYHGYVSKDELFTAFYETQLQLAIQNQKRYAIALKKRLAAAARADGGNRVGGGTYLGGKQ